MTYYTATENGYIKLDAKTLRQAKTQATKAQTWANESAVVYECQEDGIAEIVAIKFSSRNKARWEKNSNWLGETEYSSFFKKN